ncbi:MAG: hypothetical protein ACRDRT_13370 [Pseudonocardiaceae bacterium]
MPRARSAAKEGSQPVPADNLPNGSSPPLEVPTPQIKAIVGGLVNVADNAARQLDQNAPGWAYFVRQFVDVTDGVMREAP